ncbi:plasmid maintenance system killer protein [Nitrosococcus watsonii]|uniref:Plasmid maintenance system killer n=1 Tax=Nitrosococcus watsoni (strain C-113) TaxID=105559 RepID=D8KBH7_NITWC|nr:plasmid maintenance system killer protein [Nitrosococcus watsonii]ADJ29624.1 plasmid maintenance system killer [Nitrosococcus watsonii C-113]
MMTGKSLWRKGLKKFYKFGSASGAQPQYARRLKIRLVALDIAHVIEDIDILGFSLPSLQGWDKGREETRL